MLRRLQGADAKPIKTNGEVKMELWHRTSDTMLTRATFISIKGQLPDHPDVAFAAKPYHGLQKTDYADPMYNQKGTIDVLIGVTEMAKQLRDGILRNETGLIAQNTALGWIIFGGDDANCEQVSTINLVTDDDLFKLMHRLWEIDETTERKMSVEDQFVEDSFKSTVVNSNNRYHVLVPFKPGMTLGASRPTALRRFYCIEAKMRKNEEFRVAYVSQMEENIRAGYLRKATRLQPDEQHYYIPHQAALRKFRVVYDASAKTTNGNSLNDIQYTGPRLQKDLTEIVMAFRVGQIAITADIRKMYQQVDMNPAHWNYQRIIWRTNKETPPQDYWLTTVVWGTASAPYLAVRALQQCALDNEKEFPEIAKIIMSDFYMDDLLTSVENRTQAAEVKLGLISVLNRGGFELAKWRSNAHELMEEELSAKDMEEQNSTSVLGILWDYKSDEFRFKWEDNALPDILTKRFVTSLAARFYDPEGWFGPFMMRAKLFIQELWRQGIKNWDQALSEGLRNEWQQFYEEMSTLNNAKVPRWLNTTQNRRTQVHIFTDASMKAYGAAVYVRVLTNKGWEANLLCAKSRIAPIKLVTIPRLELCAVEQISDIMRKLKKIPIVGDAPVFVWTDSTIVLHWLRKPVNELKVFVANRVSRILGTISLEQIRHIPSEQNPADLISRGMRASNLLASALWWQGPEFLREEQEEWPHWKPSSSPTPELDQVQVECTIPRAQFDNVLLTTTSGDKEIDLSIRMLSYHSTCRTTAYVFRFIQRIFEPIRLKRMQQDPNYKTKIFGKVTIPENNVRTDQEIEVNQKIIKYPRLSIREIDNALNYWLMIMQKQSFPDDYEKISKGKLVANGSRLYALTPWMDENGLMRIAGRLQNIEERRNERKPIVLDYKHPMVRQLVEHAHKELCHGGVQLCTQYMRNKYWIVQSRRVIRSVVLQCLTCCRYKQETARQLMADIPRYRLQPTPAFYHCGVDFAGPIDIKVSRNVTQSGYIAVFVCMVYKAVHLEAVTGLDAASFIAALNRFINLRAGAVHHMYSDNGRNFVGANRILREARELWSDSAVLQHLQECNIQWHFNPPKAPHQGGLWEAGVKSMKGLLKRTIGAQLLTYEQLATVLSKITACLNSRPLTPMSSDPSDFLTLTPGHFLMGQQIMGPYETLLAEIPMNRLIAWQRVQKMQQDFWARWSKEYVSEQQRRNKWAKIVRSVRKDDMVFFKDEAVPPCNWLLARVTEAYEGVDGRVRTCKVRTQKGAEFVRPITELVLLPMEEDVPDSIDTEMLDIA